MSSSHYSDQTQLSNILKDEMERQIALKNLQFETEQAVKKAKSQDSFVWESLAGITTVAGTIFQAHATKNRAFAIPIVPIVMYIGWRWDEIYGTTSGKIKADAEKLYQQKRHLLKPVGGPITLEELDQRRMAWKH
uniref:Uncharacterized protein n=1 Tax=Panagrolaimus sp. ES5 TaxID=591445 RepID=A0AC34F597_9BILA